jgi:hypothetical protein
MLTIYCLKVNSVTVKAFKYQVNYYSRAEFKEAFPHFFEGENLTISGIGGMTMTDITPEQLVNMDEELHNKF